MTTDTSLRSLFFREGGSNETVPKLRPVSVPLIHFATKGDA
jgi:hypothetical protein